MKFVKNLSIYMVSNVLSQMSGFLVLPIYSKYMTTAEFGMVSILEVIFFLMSPLYSVSLDRGAQRFFFEKNDSFGDRVFSFTTSFWMLWGVVITLVFSFLFYRYEKYVGISFFPYIFMTTLSSFMYSFYMINLIYYQVNERPAGYAAVSFLRGVLILSTGFIFIYWLKTGIIGYVKAQIVTYSILFCTSLIVIRPKIKMISFDRNFKEILIFSIPFVPTVISAWMMNMSNRILLKQYLDYESVGIYSMAYKISLVYFLVTSAFTTVAVPIIYKALTDKKEMEIIEGVTEISDLVFVIFWVSVIGFSREILYFFLDPKYIVCMKYLTVIMIGHYISSMMGITSNIFLSFHKKSYQQMIFFFFAALINIGINILLIQSIGISGATYASLGSAISLALMHKIYSIKEGLNCFSFKRLLLHSIILFCLGTLIYRADCEIGNIDYLFVIMLKLALPAIIVMMYYKRIKYNLNKIKYA